MDYFSSWSTAGNVSSAACTQTTPPCSSTDISLTTECYLRPPARRQLALTVGLFYFLLPTRPQADLSFSPEHITQPLTTDRPRSRATTVKESSVHRVKLFQVTLKDGRRMAPLRPMPRPIPS